MKKSKGPLAGDQAWLPLQKRRHGQSVGHAAGRWEQPLPVRGHRAGTCLRARQAELGHRGPEPVPCRGSCRQPGQRERAGR